MMTVVGGRLLCTAQNPQYGQSNSYKRQSLLHTFHFYQYILFSTVSYTLSCCIQSHYREISWWEIFMEQELRFGLDLGWMANFIKNCHFLTPPTHLFDDVTLEWSPMKPSLQSLTGKLQGRITSQGDPCIHYREWVYRVQLSSVLVTFLSLF